jgi:hypothetical protein
MKFRNKFFAIATGLLVSTLANAAGTGSGIAAIATQVQSQFSAITFMITSASYLAGIFLIVASILKFKAHKDNPQQVAVGIPMTMFFVGAALVYLPSLVTTAGNTLFASSSTAGITGSSSIG